MHPSTYKAIFGWGVALWFFGYLLGILLFALVPTALIGWIITPIGVALTVWVVYSKIHLQSMREYLRLALIWTMIAIIFDYLFLVLLFKPADGYYKLDVYLYYALTFTLPLIVGWFKKKIVANGEVTPSNG